MSKAITSEIFNVEVTNHQLIDTAYRAYLSNGRTAQAVTLKRGEVRGGGRKPRKQKGTGRARIGSIRAPHWRGGGVTFGPTGDQNYYIHLTAIAKRKAISQALSLQNKDGKISVIDEVAVKKGKTKEIVTVLADNKCERRTLLVISGANELAIRAGANLPNLEIVMPKSVNVYNILNADNILIEKAALKEIETWLTREQKTVERTTKAKLGMAKTKVGVKEKAVSSATKPAKTKSDDLTIIEGIGPVAAKVLVKAGIDTFAKLAKASEKEVEDILKDSDAKVGHLQADSWAKQAKLADAGEMEKLKKLQDELNAGRAEK